MRHPDKVECWPDRIPDMRYPGGMRNSRPGEMRDSRPGEMRISRPGEMRISRSGGISDPTCRKGVVCVSKGGRMKNRYGLYGYGGLGEWF